MRIVHTITGLSTGGAERALYNVLSGGLATRFESAVISLRDRGAFGERIEALGVPVHALGIRHGIPGPAALLRLRSLVRELRPDVVQGWMYHGNLAASVAAAMAPGRPAVAWNVRHSLYRLEDEKRSTQWVIRAGRKLSSRPDAIIYNSRLSRAQHEAFGFAAARGRVIPNGFDLASLGPDADVRARMRQELGIPDGATVVGHVARFHPMKDHAGFLRTAVAVAHSVPQTHFLVVGREVNPENPALAGIVPPELLSRFHFPGERDNVPDYMRAMDLFCTSSAWGEAFPNVIGEAMATELPCVVTDVGDSKNIVDDTGVVVPPGDGKALESCLREMLQKDRGERLAMGKAARARMAAEYALPKVVDAYEDLYQEIYPG